MKQLQVIDSTGPSMLRARSLRQTWALHPNPEDVQRGLFRQDEFFDPRDLVQVRYEMLRRHQVDGDAVTDVADRFRRKSAGLLHDRGSV